MSTRPRSVLGLPIGPYREGVLRYFALAAEMNARVDAFVLGPHDESGAVFRDSALIAKGVA